MTPNPDWSTGGDSGKCNFQWAANPDKRVVQVEPNQIYPLSSHVSQSYDTEDVTIILLYIHFCELTGSPLSVPQSLFSLMLMQPWKCPRVTCHIKHLILYAKEGKLNMRKFFWELAQRFRTILPHWSLVISTVCIDTVIGCTSSSLTWCLVYLCLDLIARTITAWFT